MNRSRTRCLYISVSSWSDGLGRVPLVLISSSFHHPISLRPVSLIPVARLKASTARCLVSLCFLSIMRYISLNSSSICLRMALYQSSSIFLFFFISTSTCFIRSSSSSSMRRLSSLSLAMLPIEFLLGITRWSLCIALPYMQLTHSSLNSFSQQRVMKLLWIRHFCGSQFQQETRYRSRQVQKFYFRPCSDSMYSA